MCLIHPFQEKKKDGTIVATFLEDKIIESNFVTSPTATEKCSIYHDIAKISPLLKVATMLLAIFTSLLVLSGLIICCHYC
jgi:hypothetical protein